MAGRLTLGHFFRKYSLLQEILRKESYVVDDCA